MCAQPERKYQVCIFVIIEIFTIQVFGLNYNIDDNIIKETKSKDINLQVKETFLFFSVNLR